MKACPHCGTQNDDLAEFCRECRTELVEVPAVPRHRTPGLVYAGILRRFVAMVLDLLILSVLVGILVMVFRFLWVAPGFIIVWLYYALAESSGHQATPGKRLLGLRVTDLGGRRVTFGTATLRHFGKFLSGLLMGLGYLLALLTPKNQALHDLIAGCVVVEDRR